MLRPAGLRRPGGWSALAVITALHVGAMLLVILPLIAFWQTLFALPLPDAFGKLPAGWLLPVTLVAAPVLEEVIFRGWQSGRPRALWLLACFAAFLVLAWQAKAVAPVALLGLLLGLAIAALAGWLWLRKRRAPSPVFARTYPALFWAAALLFAAVHLLNYPSTSLLSLPMVLPQLWAGLLLGFTRQRLGLPAAMLQHAVANCVSMALAMAGG
ncbi:type II CAAX prenyl endopeptidase Rce1 family protein [Novosphingobium soli]|uniref:Type II CAAX prenyl endopeptidase Rce1 family protein n=1 Tax=Novosphingobium soli TaxID=574956 RepID=A0ABV6D0K3_9SPHN